MAARTHARGNSGRGLQTSRIRLAAVTRPLPAARPVASVAQSTCDQGRVELGLGGGWFEREHEAYGIPFPAVGERFDRFAEQLEIIDGLWTSDDPYSFSGKHYRIVDSPALPKPVQSPRPPIIIGGRGKKRTPALAAR